MAELRDWLNQKVLHIDLHTKASGAIEGDLRLVFQKNIFIDNDVGWRDVIQAEVRFYKFWFSPNGVDEFITAAKKWLALPLDLLGSTFFSGEWSLGEGPNHRLDLDFQPYYSTPSKTDWFTVKIEIRSERINWSEAFHVDHSCLGLLVEGLTAFA